MMNSATAKRYDSPEEYQLDLPRILVVDDEEPTLRTLSKILALNGNDSVLVKNTTEARVQLQSRTFDLLLCDVNMPGESGLELLREVRSDSPQTAVIMLTGMDSPDLASEALHLGAYGYMLKPFKPNELIINISSALRRRELEIKNSVYHTELERSIREKTREIEQALRKLRKSMSGIIKAMSLAVESRDSYTAGHQHRVSQLSSAIALEMGLSDERVEGIRLAGIVHDLGKIAVPAEILSKPGKITDFEYEIIKNHTRVGYDILKDIEFPWPIADIVLHHHERLNGSGYPFGLEGENILVGARIIAVADVVEAMASHRPYRPALGLYIALEEVKKNRGILYDADVADACLSLFNNKKFSF
jgi:putative nucleotidyltransferase with HDIG domain